MNMKKYKPNYKKIEQFNLLNFPDNRIKNKCFKTAEFQGSNSVKSEFYWDSIFCLYFPTEKIYDTSDAGNKSPYNYLINSCTAIFIAFYSRHLEKIVQTYRETK